MQALEALLSRVSFSRLEAPAPTAEQRQVLLQAAFRVPDHGWLRPWRLISIEGERRGELGELLLQGLRENQAEVGDAEREKTLAMPLRAPLLWCIVARVQPHPKVPEAEQLLTAGCAAHAVLQAAHALGLGGIWRSGPLSYTRAVAEGLGLAGNERLLGFLYLGTPVGEAHRLPELQPSDFLSDW